MSVFIFVMQYKEKHQTLCLTIITFQYGYIPRPWYLFSFKRLQHIRSPPSAFITSKENSTSWNSITHFINLPTKSRRYNTCLKGKPVQMTMECAKKYLLSFHNSTTTTTRTTFSIFDTDSLPLLWRLTQNIPDFAKHLFLLWGWRSPPLWQLPCKDTWYPL